MEMQNTSVYISELCGSSKCMIVFFKHQKFLQQRFGEDWKKCLALPPKDNRMKTSVS